MLPKLRRSREESRESPEKVMSKLSPERGVGISQVKVIRAGGQSQFRCVQGPEAKKNLPCSHSSGQVI